MNARTPLSFPAIPGIVVLLLLACLSAGAQMTHRFQCSAAALPPAKGGGPGFSLDLLTATSLYTNFYGFDLNTLPTHFATDTCSSQKPFFLSFAEPDGDYQITLVLGGTAASTTTVRAESRRLLVNQLHVAANASKTVTFNVNVRSATIYPRADAKPSPDAPLQVRLKPREIGALDWDDKLTLEFNGEPSLRSITIKPVNNVPTIYLAGDSTVVDQDKEPWAAWGQMLPIFFGPGVSIANEAESGETIRSFVDERRLAKIESTMKPGDYLLIQFAHNDQKPGSGYVPAATDYKDYLRRYIADARALGATPILVTSMNRRNFDADGKIIQTLGDYPQAMRDIAAEQKVALIDLNALSKILYEALGDAGTLHAFVHYPANTFPDQPTELKDDTHFNSYGAYELARAIVQNIRDQKLPLAQYLRPGIPAFDPAHPDAFTDWKLPPSPSVSAATPYGR